jgi:hypothetical protein
VQLAGSDPVELLAAARLVEDCADGIDLNLGCPQKCAEQGGYGAYLLREPDRVVAIVKVWPLGRIPRLSCCVNGVFGRLTEGLLCRLWQRLGACPSRARSASWRARRRR